MDSKLIGIICALDLEMTAYLSVMDNQEEEKIMGHAFISGDFKNNKIVITKCGIGKVNASIITTLLIEHFHPDLVINSGIAAGYYRELKTLDVVIGTSFLYSDFDMLADKSESLSYGQVQGLPVCYTINNELLNNIKSVITNQHIYYGTILSGDQFVTDFGKTQHLVNTYFKQYNVLAFDMESCAIAHTCYLFETKLLVVRSISDVIGSTNPFEYITFGPKAAKNAFEIVKAIIEK